MLQAATIQFLKDLKKNNDKDWFEKNRKRYEAAKENFTALNQTLLTNIAKFDASIAHLSPKDCLFRINRDVRFSKNKAPYKTNIGMSIAKGGKKGIFAGYYLHVESGKSFAGGGLFMPTPEDLKKTRQEIDYNFTEFEKIITHKKFKTVFGGLDKSSEISLVRPPKGYDETNPAINYLKLKSFIAFTPLTDAELIDKNAIKKILAAFEVLRPLLNFINRGIEG